MGVGGGGDCNFVNRGNGVNGVTIVLSVFTWQPNGDLQSASINIKKKPRRIIPASSSLLNEILCREGFIFLPCNN